MTTKYIIAGNTEQFRQWFDKNYNGTDKIVNVTSIDYLKGIHQPHGLLIGTWYLREDIERILYQLQIADSISGIQHTTLRKLVMEKINEQSKTTHQ